jgi:hypothetical protein
MSLNVEIKKITEAYQQKIKMRDEFKTKMQDTQEKINKLKLRETEEYKKMDKETALNLYDDLIKMLKKYREIYEEYKAQAEGLNEARSILFNLCP